MPGPLPKVREDATYDTLSPSQRQFVDRYMETCDPIEAAEYAGYKGGDGKNTAPLEQKARHLRKELAFIIDDRIEHYARSADFALLGINVLKQMAQQAESETVRLNAAKEIVNRTLQAPVQRKEITHNHTLSKLTTEDLDARIRVLQQKLLPAGVTVDAPSEKQSAEEA